MSHRRETRSFSFFSLSQTIQGYGSFQKLGTGPSSLILTSPTGDSDTNSDLRPLPASSRKSLQGLSLL